MSGKEQRNPIHALSHHQHLIMATTADKSTPDTWILSWPFSSTCFSIAFTVVHLLTQMGISRDFFPKGYIYRISFMSFVTP